MLTIQSEGHQSTHNPIFIHSLQHIRGIHEIKWFSLISVHPRSFETCRVSTETTPTLLVTLHIASIRLVQAEESRLVFPCKLGSMSFTLHLVSCCQEPLSLSGFLPCIHRACRALKRSTPGLILNRHIAPPALISSYDCKPYSRSK